MVPRGCSSVGMRSLGSAGADAPAYDGLTPHVHHSSVSNIFLRMCILCGAVGTPGGTRGRGVGVLAELRVEGGVRLPRQRREAEMVMTVALVDLDTGSRGVFCSYLGRTALEQ